LNAPKIPGEPERLGNYVLLERLGAGGMAVVYRGERHGEAGFKKKVALKRILPQYRRDASLLERFAAEARTNARLDHPNLVQVLDFGIDPEPYLVLEFIDGVSLSQVMQRLLEKHEKLELAAALFIVSEAALGLDHAHRKRDEAGTPLGIVHRDVSPQNVLLSNEGAVKVSDFGLVKAADNVLKTASGVSIGKISYMAPEQAHGDPVDARADIFALGVTLWELLTLESLIPPDDPARAAQILKDGLFRRPSELRPDVPPEVDQVVMQCLALNPSERMPTMQQLSLELREIVHSAAAGYGREQLARLLVWLFPEKGWALSAPDRPAAQPTADERASIVPVTPATTAMQREPAVAPAPPPVEVALERTLAASGRPSSVAPPPPPAAPRWLVVVAVLGVGSSLLLLVALAMVLGAFSYVTTQLRGETFELGTLTPGVRVWQGPTEMGALPLTLTQDDLTGEPLTAIAPGYSPEVLRAERLLEFMRGPHPSYFFELDLEQVPDQMVYVRYDGQGIAHLPSGEDLGPVPGVVRVETLPAHPTPTTLAIWDDMGHEAFTLDLTRCEPETLCVLSAGAVSPLR
jgi:tRNA A-37 threonylcarbamoyl transferase component Bud32